MSKKSKPNLFQNKKRLAEFENFYALGLYEYQNMFLAACVTEHPVKLSHVTTTVDKPKKKIFSSQYYLKDILVSKNMFLISL
jgi:hypothetical protein